MAITLALSKAAPTDDTTRFLAGFAAVVELAA
jgi:hypothetical protein